ncbi:hypothetical protein N7541_006161 [Penicillium brevicompactum]|uniref:Major facilitator superfamily (MFS) profile domain-containing protein n=1 Tax=Penicillium brevicompactum TaxID=5074 RepID=A0A9W9R4J2_PENBR|nr:hypothetical protein N7541_006161 [Penicillium brevicompactum]
MSHRTGLKVLKGAPLIGAITSVCASSFLLFGYDQGVMSGVVISDYWLDAMGHPSTVMTGTINAIYDIGGVFGAIGAALCVERLGRKRGLLVGAALIVIGAILMGCCVERIQFIAGRIVTGLGIGFLTSVAPVYQSEVCLPSQRGWHLSCQLTMMLFGLMLAYWMNYAFYFHPGAVQWRFPILFQAVFAIYILVIAPFLPDTPRWLMLHESTPERGEIVLSKLRSKPIDHVNVRKERDEILAAINVEAEQEGSWKSLFSDGGCAANKRFFLALGIQFMQQTSGINIVTYYAPTLLKSSLGMTQERALFISCFLQVWYIMASFLTWYMIDAVGRRRLYISMSIGMGVVLICEAITVAVDNQQSAIAAVFFIFAFEACFTWGWMATVWIYPAEILPLKVRSKGAALAAAADFLGNFLVVEITPPALANIGYKTYIIFAVFNIVTAFIVYCFYPETSFLSLESVDLIFLPDEQRDQQIALEQSFLQKTLQWSVVSKARIAVNEAKAKHKARLDTDAESEDNEFESELKGHSGASHAEHKEV